MHTPSSYMNSSALGLPKDHPFRAALPPRLLISADGDIVSALTTRKPTRRHGAVVDDTYVCSPVSYEFDTSELARLGASTLSFRSASSRASTASTLSVASGASTTSITSVISHASHTSEGSTSKLVRTLGDDLVHNFSDDAWNGTLVSHCPSPREVLRAIFSKTLRIDHA